MSSANLRMVAAVCAIALTLLVGYFVIQRTPLCETFSLSREVPSYDLNGNPVTEVWREEYVARVGRCGESLIDTYPRDDSGAR